MKRRVARHRLPVHRKEGRHMRFTNFSMPVVATLLSAAVHAGPKAEIEGANFVDFGTYPAKEGKSAVFVVANKGDSPLKILKVSKTCGCADAVIDKMEIPPGGSASAKVAILPDSIYGAYSKNVYFETDSPSERLLDARVSGNATPLYEIKPQAILNLGRLQPGESRVQSFRIDPVGEPFELGEPRIDCAHAVKAVLSKIDGGAWSLQVEITPDLKRGDLNLKMTLPLKSPAGWKPPEMTMTAKVGAELICIPARLTMAKGADGIWTAQAALRLLGWKGSFERDALSFSAPDGVSCSMEPKDGGQVQARISLSPSAMESVGKEGSAGVEFIHVPSGASAKLSILPALAP